MFINETYSGVRIDKLSAGSFHIPNGLKEGAVTPLLLNFASEHAIKKIQENRVGLKLNDAHQALAYADDVNLQGNYLHVDTKQ
jgi:hypothetical protein